MWFSKALLPFVFLASCGSVLGASVPVTKRSVATLCPGNKPPLHSVATYLLLANAKNESASYGFLAPGVPSGQGAPYVPAELR